MLQNSPNVEYSRTWDISARVIFKRELMTSCLSIKYQKFSTFSRKYSIPMSMYQWIMTQ